MKKKPVDLKLVRTTLSKEYGLGPVSLKRLSGFYDANFLVTAGKQKYFLKIYGGDKIPQITFQLSFIEKAKKVGLPTAAVIRTKAHKNYFVFKNTYGTLQEFLPGQTLDGKHVPEAALRDAGRKLGQLHVLSKKNTFQGKASKEYVWDLAQFDLVTQGFSNAKKYLNGATQKLVEHVFAQWGSQKPGLSGLKKGAIHGDFHTHNLLYKGARCVGITDFGDACWSWYVADVAIALVHLCYQSRNFVKLEKAFLKGYEDVIALHPLEKKYLPLLMRMRAAALVTEMTWHFEGRPPIFYKDFYRAAIRTLENVFFIL